MKDIKRLPHKKNYYNVKLCMKNQIKLYSTHPKNNKLIEQLLKHMTVFFSMWFGLLNLDTHKIINKSEFLKNMNNTNVKKFKIYLENIKRDY